MTETATVKTINERTVVLQCREDDHCLGCSVSSGCRSRERVYEAENPRHLTLAPGDEVVVDLPRRSAVNAGLLVFLLPLLLFLSLYLLADRAVPGVSDPLRAMLGLVGMAAGFGIALLAGRSRGLHRLPRISGYSGSTRLR